MENFKKYFKIIFKGLVLLLAILCVILLFRECNKQEILVNNDPTHDKQVVLNHEIKKSTATTENRETRLKAGKDTIKVVEIRYKTKVVEIIKLAPDTCNPYLIAMVNEAGVLDSAKSVYILRQDSSIQDYKRQVKLYQNVTHNDTLRINQLTDSIPKVAKSEFKRGKKVGRKQGVIGTLLAELLLLLGFLAI